MGKVNHAQPVAQQAQLSRHARHARQRRTDVEVVAGLEPLERAPMHPLRLPAVAVQYAGFPAQPPPDRVSPPRSPVVVGFTLASVRQAVALSTGEHPAGAPLQRERGVNRGSLTLSDALQPSWNDECL